MLPVLIEIVFPVLKGKSQVGATKGIELSPVALTGRKVLGYKSR